MQVLSSRPLLLLFRVAAGNDLVASRKAHSPHPTRITPHRCASAPPPAQVPARAAPGPADPSSVLWMYHSHVDETADTYAGLEGAILITSPGGDQLGRGSPRARTRSRSPALSPAVPL
jgi:hypothetical protein